MCSVGTINKVKLKPDKFNHISKKYKIINGSDTNIYNSKDFCYMLKYFCGWSIL